jgi:hypothetical protein
MNLSLVFYALIIPQLSDDVEGVRAVIGLDNSFDFTAILLEKISGLLRAAG